ncbi:MAG: VCBS repeat-containing protein [Acidobacteria bacterium]|nr:VCBS repeat-containing protein [Acidobacteriota bacterium]
MISAIKQLIRKSAGVVPVLLILTAGALTAVGAGELDPTFTSSIYGNLRSGVLAVKPQPDGKTLIGGQFTEVNGFAASGLARLNADGTVDTSFQGPDFISSAGLGGEVRSLIVLPDGRILVGGSFLAVDGVAGGGVRRLNADGTVDPSFSVVAVGTVNDMELQTDGKIVISGAFSNSLNAPNIYRLNADGTLDGTFTPPNTTIPYVDTALQPDGKILVLDSNSHLYRLNTNGTVDSTMQDNNIFGLAALTVRPDGKILIVGSFTSIGGFPVNRIALLNPNGTVDLTFNLNNPGADGTITEIALRADGKIYIAGTFSFYNTVSRTKIALLNADGTLDPSYQNPSTLVSSTVRALEIAPDGGALVGINAHTVNAPLIKFTPAGVFDPTLAPGVTRTGNVYKVVPQPDGKVLIAGDFLTIGGVKRNGLARLNADGSLDTSFVPFFNNRATATPVFSLGLQPDGKILYSSPNILGFGRLNADGSQDTGFNPPLANSVNDFALLPNGQIVLGGDMQVGSSSDHKYLARVNSNGTFDSSFAPVQPNALLWKVFAQADGKILIGGEFTAIGANARGRIARMNADGTLDTGFNPAGGANASVLSIAGQPDGKVLLGGAFSTLNGSAGQVSIGRLNADGTLDTGFVQSTNGAVTQIRIQADGKILIAGTMSAVAGGPRIGVARLNADGSVDASFDPSINAVAQDVNLQADGKILIGGQFTKVRKKSALRIARLLNAPAAPPRRYFDYDGDGKADVSVFRASENKWYILRSSDFGVTQTVFAIPNDIPVPADYDGDGKTDVAIFRPSSGSWWYLSSINNAQINVNFGQAGDIPRPSDFNGDGKTDFVLYRPSNSVWYRFSATGQTSIVAFGAAGDQPVTGDFDGDGKSDPAIFRPSTGDWWYAASASGGQFLAVHWGQTGDIPAPADYDGDGKTDFAIFRPSDGGWFVSRSSNGTFISTSFGTLGDKPIPADYDGDGKADIAVFRPSTGIWYLLQTTAGFGAVQWGIATDTPTENAFVP